MLKGLPAVNYSAHDIVYRPRNVRAHRVYGYSPVQQVLMTVNIALRRQLWQLDYFTEGSIPDALIGVPQGWTPDQIKQFQDYWDTEFAGDLAKRRRAKFVPGEAAAKVVQTKEPQHKDDFDEWLARIICFAFSVPPQWATKVMNRATAENHSAQAEEEGLEPTKEWVKDLIDEIVAEEFASPDLELHWLDEDEGDPETVLEGRLKVGALTLNEMRDALGLDPFDNAAADRPMVLTATGFVPIEANVGAGGEGADAGSAGANAETSNAAKPSARPALGKARVDDPEHPGWPAHTPGSRGGKFRPKDGDESFDVAVRLDREKKTREENKKAKEKADQEKKAQERSDRKKKAKEEADKENNKSNSTSSESSGYPINIQDEESGAHIIKEHVNKSDDYLRRRLESGAADLAAGSFTSVETANKLINATIDQNKDKVDRVVRGLESSATLELKFPNPTGYEMYMPSDRAQARHRDTYGVRVVIAKDGPPRSFRLVTAFPINKE